MRVTTFGQRQATRQRARGSLTCTEQVTPTRYAVSPPFPPIRTRTPFTLAGDARSQPAVEIRGRNQLHGHAVGKVIYHVSPTGWRSASDTIRSPAGASACPARCHPFRARVRNPLRRACPATRRSPSRRQFGILWVYLSATFSERFSVIDPRRLRAVPPAFPALLFAYGAQGRRRRRRIRYSLGPSASVSSAHELTTVSRAPRRVRPLDRQRPAHGGRARESTLAVAAARPRQTFGEY